MERLKDDKKALNPIIILLGILLLAMGLSYVLDSGEFERNGRLVVPGSYQVLEKDVSLKALFDTGVEAEIHSAKPVSLSGVLLSIPEGLERGSGLIFMVLIIGGMFGVLRDSGTIDAGLERLLGLVKGNVYVLVVLLMTVFSAGSSFLGLASEYLLVIPLMVAMAKRLGLSPIIGFAIVTISVKAGYLASVTNPLPLTIAQPLVNLPIFSGALVRFYFYLVFLTLGIGFLCYVIRGHARSTNVDLGFSGSALSIRHLSMLLILLGGIGGLVFASTQWGWKHQSLSAYYIALSLILAACSGLGLNGSADAFVAGMKKVLLASFLIGVASAVAITLEKGKILDSVVHSLVLIIGQDNPGISALGMFFCQLLLDFLIPSTSGQAAVSMPIMGPIGQLSGVSPQTTVVAFLFGNGITNMLTPTSGTLLAYLATAEVSWSSWARFILPLWAIYIVTAMALLLLCVQLGY
ncbi:Na+/H+ antiporter NhaC family protein [Congregibacter variabilis]|uniref:Na+/H+ antiporter NhaC family protein n=1 Tax=Congregibacter variabilis TaxID=3081200 RepID=A0ABZ0I241_9GAMM|nr:Na+/H+ antiporter NhaC family protein [Congregibacter sp. IMCC43200]